MHYKGVVCVCVCVSHLRCVNPFKTGESLQLMLMCVCGLKGRGADFDEPLRIEEDDNWTSETNVCLYRDIYHMYLCVLSSFNSCIVLIWSLVK